MAKIDRFPQSNVEGASLPKEVNDRANMLIIKSITRFPQSIDSSVFVEQSVLDEFDKEYTGIGIRELGRLQPDGDYAAPIVHQIHDHFGIPHKPTPDEVAEAIAGVSRIALHTIGKTTMDATAEIHIPSPDLNIDDLYLIGEEGINSRVLAADGLHAYLAHAAQIRRMVQDRVTENVDSTQRYSGRHMELLRRRIQD